MRVRLYINKVLWS